MEMFWVCCPLSLAVGVLCPGGSALILEPAVVFLPFYLPMLSLEFSNTYADSSDFPVSWESPFLSLLRGKMTQHSCMGKLCGFALEDLGFLSGHFPFTPQGVRRQLSSHASLQQPWQPGDALASHGPVCGEGKHLFHVVQARLSQLLGSWEHVCV